ncbi:MAG: XRE family transcriptional regulator [Cetobacterium sp.]|nr:XRE family transcriptional regulator [Cetobacterium sp.]
MLTTGEILKNKREKKGLSASKLAENLNVSQPYVTAIENNIKRPSKDYLQNIYNEFLFTNEEKIAIKEYESFRRLPKEIQEKLIFLQENNKKKIMQSNIKTLTENDFIEMPVRAKARAGNGYINFEETLYTKLIRRGNFCQNCYLIEVAGNSMEPLIADGAFVIVDPYQTEYIANKIYVVKIGEETFIKRILIKEDIQVMILKSINSDYDDIYIAGKELANVKLLGRAIKFIYEGNL